MEHKFKKGDRVRVRWVDYGDVEGDLHVGLEGIVDEDNSYTPYVKFPGVTWACTEDQLELVQPATVKPSTNNWIEWNGGECPVAAKDKIDVLYRDGDTSTNILRPWQMRWTNYGLDGDIIAYRVVEEAEEGFIPGTTTVDVGEAVQEDSGSAATSKHYNSMSVQPIEVWQMVLTPEEFIGALKSQVMKYSIRAGSKAGESSEKDSRKASQYKMWLELAKQGKIIDPRKDVV